MGASLSRAYRQTRYQAAGAVVRIGRRSPEMDRLLMAQRCRTATFITAFNPFSRRMPPGWNQYRQRQLSQAVRRRPYLTGTGSWRRWSEMHLLVFGDPRPVVRLARIFRQNAIVVMRIRQPAQLRSVSQIFSS